MIVTSEQVCHGVENYVAAEIAAKAPGLKKFLLYTALPGLPPIIMEKIEQVRGSGLYREVFNADGNIDLDQARSRLLNGMQHCECIEIEGIRFREADVHDLYNYIERS